MAARRQLCWPTSRPFCFAAHVYDFLWIFFGASPCTVARRFVVLVVQWLGCVLLVIERSQVRLPAGALTSQLAQLGLPSLRGR